jgi:hypothetical protein
LVLLLQQLLLLLIEKVELEEEQLGVVYVIEHWSLMEQ